MKVEVGVALALVLVGLPTLIRLRRPMRLVGRLLMRWGIGLAVLWGLQEIGPQWGVHLGVNALNGLVLGVLGAPGFGLLLLTQWVLRV